jgi:hypothetical protein
MNNNITLDVCGHIFKTTYDTIVKVPYFKNMFDGCDDIPIEPVFVNRSPKIFEHVLAVVIDPLYPYPKKYEFELDFYGVDPSNIKLYVKREEIVNEVMSEVEALLKKNIVHKCEASHCNKILGSHQKYCVGCTCNLTKCNYPRCYKNKIHGKYYCIEHQQDETDLI